VEIDPFEDAVNQLDKVPPKQRQRLITINTELVKDAASRVRQKTAALQAKASSSTVTAVGLSVIGGAGAEIVRRNLIGRVVKDARAQGAGLIVLGGLVTWGGKKIPFLREIGAAHCAVGAAVMTSALHGSEDKKDPVRFALEETTYKAKHPPKKDESKKDAA
jgi:hypothetical protein